MGVYSGIACVTLTACTSHVLIIFDIFISKLLSRPGISVYYRALYTTFSAEILAEIRRNFGRKILLGGLPPPQTPPGKIEGGCRPPKPPRTVKKRRAADAEIGAKIDRQKTSVWAPKWP